MIIVVPFVYKTDVIRSRCRNPVELIVKDHVRITVSSCLTLDSVASWRARAHDGQWFDTHLFYFNHEFWETIHDYVRGENKCRELTSDDLVDYVFWHMRPENIVAPVIDSSEGEIKQWCSSNRNLRIAEIHSLASKFLVAGNRLLRRTEEPAYHVVRNEFIGARGGTEIILDSFPSALQRSCTTKLYPLNALHSALEFATDLAKSRGDFSSLPLKPDVVATVKNPEVFGRSVEWVHKGRKSSKRTGLTTLASTVDIHRLDLEIESVLKADGDKVFSYGAMDKLKFLASRGYTLKQLHELVGVDVISNSQEQDL